MFQLTTVHAKRRIEEALGDPGEGRGAEPPRDPRAATAEKFQRVFNADTRRGPARTVESRKTKNAT
jgi:hypothetical protein